MRSLFAVIAIFVAHTVFAASVSINPVRLNLSAQQPVGSLSLTNQGDQPVVLQLDVAAWTQVEGNDVDMPTDELLATPPMVSIAPGATQLVRVGLRHPTASAQERSYRLFLQEIPNDIPTNTSALQFRLRFAVPVFVPVTGAVAASLTWEASTRDGVLSVRAHNSTSKHVQIISMSGKAGDANVLSTAPSYVLPGQTRTWTSSWNGASIAALHIEASTDAGPMQAELSVPSH